MMMAPAFAPWRAVHFLFLFAMWLVMMVGMMTPSAAPMALIYAQVARHSASLGQAFASVGWFVAGYLLAWTLFSVLAALAQWGLESLALITPMMMKVDFTSIRNVSKRPTGLLVTLVVNWLVKPFSMALLAWLFFRLVFSAFISAPALSGARLPRPPR